MEKKTKILFFIIILLIIIIGAIGLYKFTQFDNYTLKIIEINGNNIKAVELNSILYTFMEDEEVVKNINGQEIDSSEIKIGDSVIVDEYADRICTVTKIENNEITVSVPTYYEFSTENAKIKDINGNNIDIFKLQVGNVIEVLNKKDNSINKAQMASSIKNLNDVKQIKVIDNKVEKSSNMIATLKAVVVKVNDNNFLAMGIEKGTGLYSIGLDNIKDIELKKGQEILIYFNGDVMETYPAQLGDVGKIEIVKDKSDTPIPDDILRYCYSSKDNVTITISELSNKGIILNIKDTNELPYNYSHSYVINKKVKNENYTGIGEQIGENTNNSTAGYTRNWNRIYMERIK